jgi:hypothetical protein
MTVVSIPAPRRASGIRYTLSRSCMLNTRLSGTLEYIAIFSRTLRLTGLLARHAMMCG